MPSPEHYYLPIISALASQKKHKTTKTPSLNPYAKQCKHIFIHRVVSNLNASSRRVSTLKLEVYV